MKAAESAGCGISGSKEGDLEGRVFFPPFLFSLNFVKL